MNVTYLLAITMILWNCSPDSGTTFSGASSLISGNAIPVEIDGDNNATAEIDDGKIIAARILVNDESNAMIKMGSNVAVSWNSENADDCFLTPGKWGGLQGREVSGPIEVQTDFVVYCQKGSTIVKSTARVTIEDQAELMLKVNDQAEAAIDYNESVTVSWAGSYVDNCELSIGDGETIKTESVNSSGEKVDNAMQNLSYLLACTDVNDRTHIITSAAKLEVKIPEAEIDFFVQGPDGVIKNGETLLVDLQSEFTVGWRVANMKNCALDILGEEVSFDIKNLNEQELVRSVTKPGFISLECKDLQGNPLDRSVIVEAIEMPEIVFKVDDVAITAKNVSHEWNTKIQFSWEIEKAESCSADFVDKVGIPSGKMKSEKLTSDKKFTITCTSIHGKKVSKSIKAKIIDSREHESSKGQMNTVFPEVDVVFLVDTSSSMNHESDQVNKNIDTFVNEFTKKHSDKQVRVLVVSDEYKLGNNSNKIIMHKNKGVGSNNALKIFLKEIAINPDLLRMNSTKEIVIISDDKSDMSADKFQKRLVNVSEWNEWDDITSDKAKYAVSVLKNKVHVSAIAWTRKHGEGTKTCKRGGSSPDDLAEVYRQLAADKRTEGKIYDLCSENWEGLLKDLADDLISKQAQAEFVLAAEADPKSGLWITVDNKAISDSDYTYNADRHSIVFKSGKIPAVNAKVEFRYYKK